MEPAVSLLVRQCSRLRHDVPAVATGGNALDGLPAVGPARNTRHTDRPFDRVGAIRAGPPIVLVARRRTVSRTTITTPLSSPKRSSQSLVAQESWISPLFKQALCAVSH